jgi:hypothetical protein
MRIVIAGSRHWNCPDLAEEIVNRLFARYGPAIVIIHGDEPGIAESFAEAARGLCIATEERGRVQNQTGKPTVAAKNRELLQAGADLCIVLHRSIAASKRTRDCAQQAVQAGIPVYVIEDERAIPRRLRRGGVR